MDGDGDNPFADPQLLHQTKTIGQRSVGGGYGTNGSTTNNNVRATMDDYDPFGDVGAQPVVSQAPASRPDPLEGYNPFETKAPPGPAPAVLATEPPPAFTPSPATQVTTDHYKQQQRELDRKARELEERERELRLRDEQQQQQQKQLQQGNNTSGNNWPPFPKWIPIKPCFYQDFEVDIPHEFQHVVKLMYYLWLCHVVVLLLNFIGSLGYLFTDATDYALGCFLAVVWLVLFTPCSFVCWFRSLYKAFRSDSSLNFMIFFFIFAAQAAVTIIMAVGISSGSGFFGIFNGLGYMKTDKALGIICLVIGVLQALLAAGDIFMLMRIHRLYRSRDGVSVAQARNEAVSGLMSNKDVRDTVVDVGVAAATSGATRN